MKTPRPNPNGRRIKALASRVAELRARGSTRRLRPPLDDAQLAELEARIGGPLPEDLRAFYREVTGGEDPTDVPPILTPDSATTASTSGLEEPFPFGDDDADSLIAANHARRADTPPAVRAGPWCGALPIMDLSNAINAVVLRGEQRGRVWQRWDGGWTPLYRVKKGQPEPLDFLSFIEAEIADALKSAPPPIMADSRVVRLVGLRIQEPPIALRAATGVEELLLSGNQIQAMPEWIGELDALREVRVSNNPLSSLPASLRRASKLEILDVSLTRLTALPPWIGELRALRHLLATSSALVHLPDTIGDLRALTHLHLARNALERLPERIGDLGQLVELDLAANALTALPDSMGQLARLRGLKIANNPLRSLPAAFARLPIEMLDLEGLHDLDWCAATAVLAQMRALRSLRIHGAPPSCLPGLAGLTQLRTLRLIAMGLTEVPDGVAALPALETLSLDQNKLTTIPDDIGAMASLKTLVLFSNPIPPEEIARLRARLPDLVIEHV